METIKTNRYLIKTCLNKVVVRAINLGEAVKLFLIYNGHSEKQAITNNLLTFNFLGRNVPMTIRRLNWNQATSYYNGGSTFEINRKVCLLD